MYTFYRREVCPKAATTLSNSVIVRSLNIGSVRGQLRLGLQDKVQADPTSEKAIITSSLYVFINVSEVRSSL